MSQRDIEQKKKFKQQSKQIFISQLKTIGQMPTFYIQDWRTSQNTENSLPTIKEKQKLKLRKIKHKNTNRVYESLPRISNKITQCEQKLKNYQSLHNLNTYRQVLPLLKSQILEKQLIKKQTNRKFIYQNQNLCILYSKCPRIKSFSSHQDIRKLQNKQTQKLKTQHKNKTQVRINEVKLNTKVSSVLEILKKYQKESKQSRFSSSRKKIVQILNQNKINKIMRLKINQKPPSLSQSINYFIAKNKQ